MRIPSFQLRSCQRWLSPSSQFQSDQHKFYSLFCVRAREAVQRSSQFYRSIIIVISSILIAVVQVFNKEYGMQGSCVGAVSKDPMQWSQSTSKGSGNDIRARSKGRKPSVRVSSESAVRFVANKWQSEIHMDLQDRVKYIWIYRNVPDRRQVVRFAQQAQSNVQLTEFRR